MASSFIESRVFGKPAPNTGVPRGLLRSGTSQLEPDTRLVVWSSRQGIYEQVLREQRAAHAFEAAAKK